MSELAKLKKNLLTGWKWSLFATYFNVMVYLLLRRGLKHPSIKPGLKNTQRLRNLSYGPHKDNLIDAYVPQNRQGPLPIVMYIHGGGFGTCSKNSHQVAAEKYAQMGYLVFQVEYRLAPKHPYPAGPQDVCAAYEWITKHAAEYDGDLDRLTVAGESAGANLTATIMMGACWQRPEPWLKQVWDTGVMPKAFQVICGYLHVTEPQKRYAGLEKARSWIVRFVLKVVNSFAYGYLGDKAAVANDETLLIDTVRYLQQAPVADRPIPPVFAPVGAKDVIKQDTYDLAEALRERDVIVDEKTYPKEPHAFQLMMSQPQTANYWRDCEAFMQTHVLETGTETARAA